MTVAELMTLLADQKPSARVLVFDHFHPDRTTTIGANCVLSMDDHNGPVAIICHQEDGDAELAVASERSEESSPRQVAGEGSRDAPLSNLTASTAGGGSSCTNLVYDAPRGASESGCQSEALLAERWEFVIQLLRDAGVDPSDDPYGDLRALVLGRESDPAPKSDGLCKSEGEP
jgi:hypothetical protein